MAKYVRCGDHGTMNETHKATMRESRGAHWKTQWRRASPRREGEV